MSRKKGQVYSAEQKTKIVLELLKEDQTINQLATKYQITAKSIQNWKNQFLENASLAFEPAKVVQEFKDELKSKDEEIAELQKQLGKSVVEKEWLAKKLESSVSLNKRKTLVEDELELNITVQCRLLGISRATHYYKPVPMSTEDVVIMHAIDEIATDNSEYGYRLIHCQLMEDGYGIGKDRVLKYMQFMGIQAIYPTKKRLTSIKNPEHMVYQYLLKQYWTTIGRTKQVYVPTPNEVWSGDITYIRTNGGFMYLAAVIDWHSKAILAYKISNSMDATLAVDVLKEALGKYPKPKIFNSDQGSQYTSYEHTQVLKQHEIQISMNGRGRSIDNIVIERFFRTLKHSNIYISDYQSIKELKDGVNAYMHKYNFKRFHSSIGYQKPMNLYLEYLKSVG
ncbi:IS3 family transposase [Sulfurimonas sp.]|uniref:IS3 family transposase n=1 Tax=Sulfurimonas sp. TaxID=2022749 RepID=UPI0025E7E4F2|nr:IS3 family transposase [Sulfurimonas sp.]